MEDFFDFSFSDLIFFFDFPESRSLATEDLATGERCSLLLLSSNTGFSDLIFLIEGLFSLVGVYKNKEKNHSNQPFGVYVASKFHWILQKKP